MHPTRIFKHPDELLKAWEDYKSERDLEAKKWYIGSDGLIWFRHKWIKIK